MGDPSPGSKTRDFSDLNELYDQKAAPGWHRAEVAIQVLIRHTFHPEKREWCIIREVNGRHTWSFARAAIRPVVEGMLQAQVRESKRAIRKGSAIVVRRIELHGMPPEEEKRILMDSPVNVAMTLSQNRNRLVIAMQYRKGRTHDGVTMFEKEIILADQHSVLQMPASKLDRFIELLKTAYYKDCPITLHGADREYLVGVVS